MTTSISTRLFAVAATLALFLAGCGGGDDSGSSYKEPAGPAVSDVKIESGNIFFKPTKVDSTPAGITAITLENQSGLHDIVIRDVPGFQIEVSGEGDTATEKVDLAKGKYEFYCTIPGHEEAGMKGTLTIS
jgi:plastocyanin